MAQDQFNVIVSNTHDYLLNLINRDLVIDENVNSWALMGTPWPVISILILYLLIVLKVGPNMMKNRNPMNLRYPILLYNVTQTFFNSWLTYRIFLTLYNISFTFNLSCHPPPKDTTYFRLYGMNESAWYFFVSKVMDLIETVFFILRKKQSQVSFLHIYHHTNMVILTWTYLKYFKGYQMIICAAINTVVHVVMYSYYFLSALGPQVQKYLWWKKYLTRMQIIQFIAILAYNLTLFMFNCQIPQLFIVFMTADTVLFLYLFLTFYMSTYKTKSEKKLQ